MWLVSLPLTVWNLLKTFIVWIGLLVVGIFKKVIGMFWSILGKCTIKPRNRMFSTAKIEAKYHDQVMEIRERRPTAFSMDIPPPTTGVEQLFLAASKPQITFIKSKLEEFSRRPRWGVSKIYFTIHGQYQKALELGLKSFTEDNVRTFNQQMTLLTELEEKFNQTFGQRVSTSIKGLFKGKKTASQMEVQKSLVALSANKREGFIGRLRKKAAVKNE